MGLLSFLEIQANIAQTIVGFVYPRWMGHKKTFRRLKCVPSHKSNSPVDVFRANALFSIVVKEEFKESNKACP